MKKIICLIVGVVYLFGCKKTTTYTNQDKRESGFQFVPIQHSPKGIDDAIILPGNSLVGQKRDGSTLTIYITDDYGGHWRSDTTFKFDHKIFSSDLRLSRDKKNLLITISNSAGVIQKAITRKIGGLSRWSKLFGTEPQTPYRKLLMNNDSIVYGLDTSGQVICHNRLNSKMTSIYSFTSKPDGGYSYFLHIQDSKLLFYPSRHDRMGFYAPQTLYLISLTDNKVDSINAGTDTNSPFFLTLSFKYNAQNKTFSLPGKQFKQAGVSYLMLKGYLGEKNITTKTIITDSAIYDSFSKVNSSVWNNNFPVSPNNNSFSRRQFECDLQSKLIIKTQGNDSYTAMGGHDFMGNALPQIDTALRFFEYSNNLGKNWKLLKLDRNFEKVEFLQENIHNYDTLLLKDREDALIGLCYRKQESPTVTSTSCRQDLSTLHLTIGYEGKIEKPALYLQNEKVRRLSKQNYYRLDSSQVKLKIKPGVIEADLSLSSLPYKLESPDRADFALMLETTTGREVIDVTGLEIEGASLGKYAPYFFIGIGVLSFYFCIFLLYLFFPLTLFDFYHSKYFPLIEELTGGAGKPIKILNGLFFYNFFIDTEKMHNIWLGKFSPLIISRFNDYRPVKERELYVPIPIRQRNLAMAEISFTKEPDARFALALFPPKPQDKNVIQIIGYGGAGKTSLACKIVNWLSDQEQREADRHSFPMILPVFIDEETEDVKTLVIKKIQKITGNSYADFLESVLKSGKILIIVDAISEKSRSMQDKFFEQLTYEAALTNVMITSRRVMEKTPVTSKLLFPEPIKAEMVSGFIKELCLKQNINIFSSVESQGYLLTKLGKVFRYKTEELVLNPILLKLIVEQIKLFFNDYPDLGESEEISRRVVDFLPENVPGLYEKYLLALNKPSGGIIMDYFEFVAAIEYFSDACLSKNFTPKETPVTKIQTALAAAPLKQSFGEILALMDQSGLIGLNQVDDNNPAMKSVYFILDPICEYFAASHVAKINGADEEIWSAYYGELLAAQPFPVGFAQSIVLIHSTTWGRYDLIDPRKIDLFHALETKVSENRTMLLNVH